MIGLKRRVVVLLTVLLLASATGLTLQELHAQLPGDLVTECESRCDLSISHVVTLGRNGNLGYVGRPRAVLQLSDGRYLLADRADQDRLKLYNSQGAFLTSIGRRGEGPGEYQVIEHVALLPGDSIEVYDLVNLNATVLGPAFKVSRIIPMTLRIMSQARFASDVRVAAANYPTADGVGLPLHVVGADGTIIRSFGAEPPVLELQNPEAIMRSVAPAGPASVWSGHLLRYRIEEWSLTGDLRRVLDREVPWFAPHEDFGFQPDAPPNPGIRAIHQGSDGLLWVVVLIADAGWQEGVGEVTSPISGNIIKAVVDQTAYYDTMIEVIDPTTARLVASARFDERLFGFAGDGLVYSYQEAGGREPYIDVWQVRRNF